MRGNQCHISCYISKGCWVLLNRKCKRERCGKSGVIRRALYAYCKDELTDEEKQELNKKED